jgi:hypothetical protein
VTEDEDRQLPRPHATPPPHAYRTGIIGMGIAAIGNVKINIVTFVLAIDYRDSVAIVINSDVTISAHWRANVATTYDLAIVVVTIIGDPANNAYRQDNADTSYN